MRRKALIPQIQQVFDAFLRALRGGRRQSAVERLALVQCVRAKLWHTNLHGPHITVGQRGGDGKHGGVALQQIQRVQWNGANHLLIGNGGRRISLAEWAGAHDEELDLFATFHVAFPHRRHFGRLCGTEVRCVEDFAQ